MYYHGEGVLQNFEEANRWFRLAAEQGYSDAQYVLAQVYENGTGVPQNRAEAAKWYRLAAEQGNVDAQFNLALMYNRGEGVLQSFEEASRQEPGCVRQSTTLPKSHREPSRPHSGSKSRWDIVDPCLQVPGPCCSRVVSSRGGAQPAEARRMDRRASRLAVHLLCNGVPRTSIRSCSSA